MSTRELTALDAKMHILKEGNYVYNFDRQVYFNRKAKKAFSVEFIQDHSANELADCIFEPTGESNWQFYFNAKPSESVRSQLEVSLS